jgi:hypothetical protein
MIINIVPSKSGLLMVGKWDKNIEKDMRRTLKSGIFEWISLEVYGNGNKKSPSSFKQKRCCLVEMAGFGGKS